MVKALAHKNGLGWFRRFTEISKISSICTNLTNCPLKRRNSPYAPGTGCSRLSCDLGVLFEEEAVEAVLSVTECYPYFLQEWGFHVWNVAPKGRIRRIDVEQATPGVVRHLDANFFRARFDRLTALQQKYLRAMAQLGPGPHKTGDVARTLGVKAAAVATARQQFIDKGMVWSQRHGENAFTVPMFDAFMKRQMPIFERHKPKRRPRPAHR